MSYHALFPMTVKSRGLRATGEPRRSKASREGLHVQAHEHPHGSKAAPSFSETWEAFPQYRPGKSHPSKSERSEAEMRSQLKGAPATKKESERESSSGGWFTKFWKNDPDAREDSKKADTKYSLQISATEDGFVKNYKPPSGPKPRRPTEPEYVNLRNASLELKRSRRSEARKHRADAAVEDRSAASVISRWQQSGHWAPLSMEEKQRPLSVSSITAIVGGDMDSEDKSLWPEAPDLLAGDILENFHELPVLLGAANEEFDDDYCDDDAQAEPIAELEAPAPPKFRCVVDPPTEPPRQQDDALLTVNDAWKRVARKEKKRARACEREVEELVRVAGPIMAAFESLRGKEGFEGMLTDDSYEGAELLLERLLEDRDTSKRERDYYLARLNSSDRKQQLLEMQLRESRR